MATLTMPYGKLLKVVKAKTAVMMIKTKKMMKVMRIKTKKMMKVIKTKTTIEETGKTMNKKKKKQHKKKKAHGHVLLTMVNACLGRLSIFSDAH